MKKDKIKFINIRIINGELMDYQREYLEGLTNDEIGLFLLGMEALKKELLDDFLSRKPMYKVSTDPNDLEDDEDSE